MTEKLNKYLLCDIHILTPPSKKPSSQFVLEVLAQPHEPKGAADDILIDQEHEGSRQHCLQ